jgi:ATP synthase protein I
MSASPTGPSSDDDIELARSVAARAARRAFWQAHGERSLAKNLAMIGALGWLVVTPAVAGLYLGRWLDHRFAAGIFWTGALLVAGVALGCWMAWRRIQRIQQEDEG